MPARPAPDPKALVRAGHDAVPERHRGDDESPPRYRARPDLLPDRLPVASVLDPGRGCGVPVSRDPDAGGHRVLGR